MATTKNTQTLNNLQWIQYQLANGLNLEREVDEIWWAVYNDAARDKKLAAEMVEHLANDRIALSNFAASLAHSGVKVVVTERPMISKLDLAIICSVCVSLGFLIGVAL